MIIGRYLQWVETAPLAARVDAARSLVEIYASPDLTRQGRSDAELALFALLDDPSAAVRRALAEAASHTIHVPRHLVAALAQDQSSVAVPVLRFSPLLDEADLIDAVAIGDSIAHCAIACRPHVSAAVAGALTEIANSATAVALCENDGADLGQAALRRLLERFRDVGCVREALLARGDLDPALHHDLVVATAKALTGFATGCDWMSPARAEQVTREARDKAAITIAATRPADADVATARRLVAHLRARGHLTPALVLRALLSAHLPLFEAALAELSGAAPIRVAGHIREASGLGFASLYEKAGLPAVLLPVFRAGLAALRSGGERAGATGMMRRSMVVAALDACKGSKDPGMGRVAALLRRFEGEASREEARAAAANAWAEDPAEALPALLPWIVGSQSAAPRLTLQSAA